MLLTGLYQKLLYANKTVIYGWFIEMEFINGEDVNDLIKTTKKELSPKLNDVAIHDINLRRHGEEVDLRSGLPVERVPLYDAEITEEYLIITNDIEKAIY